MFEQTFVDGQAKTRRPATIVISLLLQCLVIGILILIPLIYTESLGMAQLKATLIAPPPDNMAGVVGGVGVPGGAMGGVIGGVVGSVGAAPPPPPPPAAKPTGPVRVGGRVQEANLIHKVTPIYPPLAKSARVQGTVEFTAIIGKDGTIRELKLVRGHPLLVNAARQAVEQWRYKPTMLNGEAVDVITDIVVNFTLSQ